MDSDSQLAAYIAMDDIRKILQTGIFTKGNAQNPLMPPAFISVLISLRDLMYKCEKFAARIAFTDDINLSTKVNDVSALIKHVRDALCHPDSDNHNLSENIMISFSVVWGKGIVLETDDHKIESIYEDDVCFFFGQHGIYLRRHIIRAIEEARILLLPKMDESYAYLLKGISFDY